MRNGSLCLKLPNIQVFCGTSKIYPRHFIFRQYITTTSVQVLHTLPIKSKMMKKNIIAISPPYYIWPMWIESEAHDLLHHCYADNTQRYFFCESSQTVETESSTYFARTLRTEVNLFVTQELK